MRCRALLSPRRAERDLREELDFHLERQAHEEARTGLPADVARGRARMRFGSPALAADECRDARGVTFIETTARDIVYAWRGLRRTPTVALTIVGTVALALGLTASVFTVFNRVVLRVDAVRDPQELVGIVWPNAQQSGRSGRTEFTLRQYEALRRETDVFSEVAARLLDVETRIEGRMASVHMVTGNYFQTLGVEAALGRTLSSADATRTGSEPVLVLSHQGWRRLFDANPNVVGRSVSINGFPFTILGVTPEGFLGLDTFGVDCWVPLTMFGEVRRHTPGDNPWSLEVIGRLKPGMSRATARSALAVWAAQTTEGRPVGAPPETVRLESRRTATPLSAGVVLGFSPLFIAFGLILVIACANVANLLLARGVVRHREIGVRLSLGASRGRIVRQLVTEGLLLALVAAIGALVVSRVVIDASIWALLSTMPPELSEFIGDVSAPMDLRVVGFILVMAVMSTAVFSLVPALQTSRPNLNRIVRGEIGKDPRPHRTRSALIIVQVAASALLLICAGIFLRAAQRSVPDNPGIRVDDTIVMEFEERSRPALVAAIAADPAVARFAASWPGPPLLNRARTASGAPAGRSDRWPANYRLISSAYFDVLGIPVVSGRQFTEAEAASSAAVAMLSETAAREFWPENNAIGQVVRLTPDPSERFGREEEPPLSSQTFVVVGIARDVTGHPMGHPEARVYLPSPVTTADATIVLRVNGDTNVARRAIVGRLTAIDPNIGMVMMMRSVMAIGTYPLQVVFSIVVVLGSIALALTMSGIFGVLSYLVVQRTKEIGVRMALGATAGAVTRQLLGQALRLVYVGLAIGVGLAWAMSSVIMSVQEPSGSPGSMGAQLVSVINPFDAMAYAGSLTFIAMASVAAALIPALRAAWIDPIATLRHD